MINKDIVIIGGFAGSGKDTLAASICSVYGHKRISLADPLKDLARRCLDREIDKKTDRNFLIGLGQYMRGIDQKKFNDEYGFRNSKHIARFLLENKACYQYFWTPEFWAQIVKFQVNDGSKWIIPDMRFKSEFNVLKSLSPFSVGLVVPREVCENRLIARDGGFPPNLWESVSEKEWQFLPYTMLLVADDTCTQERRFERFTEIYDHF